MSKKGGGPLILGMAENPSSKELVEYDEKQQGKRKTLKKKSQRKKKSLKKKKSLRKRK
jgi:hypothetical protein